ncbi:MAG: DUF1772 domain-containing protein [Candidatus Binataceae bacterium]
MTQFLNLIATLSAAFFAGGATYVSLAEHPARLADPAIALRQFQLSYPRAARWQASMAALCLLTAVVATWLGAGWWCAIGGLAVGAVIPFTLIVMKPLNHRLLDQTIPLTTAEAAALLRRWGQLHWVRSLLGALGLLILLASNGVR